MRRRLADPFFLDLRAMPCGKKNPGRDEGARADGEELPFELLFEGFDHIGSHVGVGVRAGVGLAIYDGLGHPAGQQEG
jgi:hypothetical protein